MRRYRKWVLSLGIMAVTPGIAMAGPFSFQRLKANKTAPAASSRSNQQVAEQIAGSLRAAKINGFEIDIEYRDGVAHLKGKVQDAAQKKKASRVVSKVKGVKKVNNQLTLIGARARGGNPSRILQASHSQPANQSNQKTAEKIAGALSKAKLSGFDIEVRFKHGQATLAGSVQSPQQRAKATKVVSKVPGVQRVDNRLAVEGNSAPPSSTYPNYYGAAPQMPHQGQIAQAGYQQPMGPGPAAMAGYGSPGPGDAQMIYNNPNLPETAWPTYASYPNYAQVAYPTQYSASAWPYIGPFYPYPQVPLGWRQATLEWDDGFWNLNFRPRTDRWWWFLHPKNW